MSSEELESASNHLSAMTETGVTAWLRSALVKGPHPFPSGRDDLPAAALSDVPSLLSLDLAARFRAALVNLLDDFSVRPANWGENEAEELLALASLLGTDAMPGREPWDLGFAVSLAALVSGNWEAFANLSLRVRARVLALLRSGPVHLHPGFWMNFAARNYEQHATIAWRGLLRDDWLTACTRMLCRIPDTDAAHEAVRNHAAYAARQIKGPRGEEKQEMLEAALPLAAPGVVKTLTDCLAAEGIRLRTGSARPIFVPVSLQLSKSLRIAKPRLTQGALHPLGVLIEIEAAAARQVFFLLDALVLAVRAGEDPDELAKSYALAASPTQIDATGQQSGSDREGFGFDPDAPDRDEPSLKNVIQGDFSRFAEMVKPDLSKIPDNIRPRDARVG